MLNVVDRNDAGDGAVNGGQQPAGVEQLVRVLHLTRCNVHGLAGPDGQLVGAGRLEGVLHLRRDGVHPGARIAGCKIERMA